MLRDHLATGRFWRYRKTTRALILWTGLVALFTLVTAVLNRANAPVVLATVLVLWLVGVVVIAVIRYGPTPKR